MTALNIIYLCFTAIIVGFFILVFLVAYLEKRPIAPYGSADFESLPEPSPYFLAMNDSARQLGFIFVGAQAIKYKSKTYKSYVALWLSPDNRSVLRIGGGTTAGVPEKRTFLTTCLQDNQIIESMDFHGAYEYSGLTDRKLLLNADLNELFAFHQQRLASQPLAVREFNTATAAEMLDSINAMRAQRLVDFGMARYVNKERTMWSYSLKGAMNVCLAFRHGLDEVSKQKDRAKIKRPGD